MDLKFLLHQKCDLFYILPQQRPGEFFHWLLFSQLHGMILVTKLICYVMGLIICPNYLSITKMSLTQVSDFLFFSKIGRSGPKVNNFAKKFQTRFYICSNEPSVIRYIHWWALLDAESIGQIYNPSTIWYFFILKSSNHIYWFLIKIDQTMPFNSKW